MTQWGRALSLHKLEVPRSDPWHSQELGMAAARLTLQVRETDVSLGPLDISPVEYGEPQVQWESLLQGIM